MRGPSFLLLLAFLAGGCASARAVTPPIQTEAALGRVVVYRNGVAYFERRATIHGNELKLDVPGERLDDFLKSLTVEDVKTKKLVPISFPTLEDQADEVTIQLELPKNGVHELKITYVTESPSWKPSYRLELHGSKPARLEAWAVVHNVSGEDWKHVAVGVGSTSALSFKYDLRSVHFVDRATLSDQTELGVAPPTGGSPYQVASKEVQMLGTVRRPVVHEPKRGELADESAGRSLRRRGEQPLRRAHRWTTPNLRLLAMTGSPRWRNARAARDRKFVSRVTRAPKTKIAKARRSPTRTWCATDW